MNDRGEYGNSISGDYVGEDYGDYVGADYVGEEPVSMAYYAPLSLLIETHADFWSRQPSTGSGAGSDWHRRRWMAFYNRWRSLLSHSWKNALNDLIELRKEAAQLGIPLPNLGSSQLESLLQRGVSVDGEYGGDYVGEDYVGDDRRRRHHRHRDRDRHRHRDRDRHHWRRWSRGGWPSAWGWPYGGYGLQSYNLPYAYSLPYYGLPVRNVASVTVFPDWNLRRQSRWMRHLLGAEIDLGEANG